MEICLKSLKGDVMKKYEVVYKEYDTESIISFFVYAETQEDARDYFFKHKSGMLLRVTFVGYV